MHQVTFNGNFPQANVSNTQVAFGHASAIAAMRTFRADPNAGIFNCTVLSVTAGSSGAITCETTGGQGYQLIFVAFINGLPSNTLDPKDLDTYSFPPPTLTNTTLRSPGGVGTQDYRSNATQSELIQFDGTNFPPQGGPGLVTVTYGEDGFETQYTCAVVSSTSTTLTCQTSPAAPPLPVRNLRFKFVFGLGPCPTPGLANNLQTCAAYTLYSVDRFSYAQAPIVYTVTGCPSTDENRTAMCPTDGKDPATGAAIVLSITGEFFRVGAVPDVLIGGAACTSPTVVSGVLMTCRLPVGAGLRRALVITQDGRYSPTYDYVSYAPATITSVSGCEPDGSSTKNCSRDGGDTITISGINFGVSDAKVVLGGAVRIPYTRPPLFACLPC